MINMFPAILIMILFDDLVLGNTKNNIFYIGFSIMILVVMFVLLRTEYNTLYNSTYKESANLRLDIADTLSKLPLSYFSKHNLSDLSQTIMADVAAIEHAMSHAMAKTIGFFLFLPLVSVLLLTGNLKLGLAVILPILIGFLLIVWSKKIQLKENIKYYTKLRDNSDSFQEAIELQQEIKSLALTQKIKKSLYQKMEEGEKIHLKAELTAAAPLLLSGFVVQSAFAIVMLIGTGLLLKGEISIIYLIGYILVSIKIKEAVDGVSQNIAELYYIDSMINRIKEIRNTKIQKGEVREAARLANCEEFVLGLPNGYDTVIGENGATLSGGERQRLSIARAFLKNAPIIILDEIAASLDVDNDKEIQESFNELTKNKTVIIISHRLKSIENVDKIVVIDHGEVEAFGKHKELIAKSRTYNNLVEKAKLAEVFKY